MVGYVLRFHPGCQFLKNALQEKIIGVVSEVDFYCYSWLPNWRKGTNYKENVSSKIELGGGALLELSHEIDLANYLFGPISLKNCLLWSIDGYNKCKLVL